MAGDLGLGKIIYIYQDRAGAHGAPLGEEEVALTRQDGPSAVVLSRQ